MNWLRRIHLIDKCLIVFMMVFLVQAGFTLFMNPPQSPDANTIDVIFRTSAAAIFGYFISANFVRHDSLEDAKLSKKPEVQIQEDSKEITRDDGNTVKNRIGFSLPGTESQVVEGFADGIETKEKKQEIASHLQIIITSVIGIIALCMLLLYRNFFDISSVSASTVSQLRDFVSSCVGFLIGGTTSRGNTK